MKPHAPMPRRCSACQRVFTCTSAYSLHLLGRRAHDPRCRTDSEMRLIGMGQRADGAWLSKVSLKPKPAPLVSRLGRRRPFA